MHSADYYSTEARNVKRSFPLPAGHRRSAPAEAEARFRGPGSVAGAGVDDLAHVPEAGGLPGGRQALLRGGEGQLRRAAAAVQAGDIQAPAVLLLDHPRAVAQGAVLQVDVLIEFHVSVSFFRDGQQYTTLWPGTQPGRPGFSSVAGGLPLHQGPFRGQVRVEQGGEDHGHGQGGDPDGPAHQQVAEHRAHHGVREMTRPRA